MTNYPDVSFNNTEFAFQYKTDKELKGAGRLFSLMDFPLLVKLGTKITPWLIRNKFPVKNLIKKTLFTQFTGGETLEQTAKVADKLEQYHVQVILDYGVEGGENSEAEFERSTNEFIRVIDYAATQPNIPFMSVKVTGLTRFQLLEELDERMQRFQGSLIKRYFNSLEQLSKEQREEWHRVRHRLLRICQKACEKNVGMLIDAEESWIQDPVDALVILMMDSFNKTKTIIYNTAQLYRHDRLNFVKDCYEAAEERNFILGLKLVRGAYMNKERRRAAENKYQDPIQPDKAATDKDFDEAVKFCISHISRISAIVATHNEESNMKAVQQLMENNLPLNHPHISFSQLYGMSDNITFNLANAGCNVSKYLPFGPVEDVVPYLMRRAEENTSVQGQTGRELSLIKKELKRRNL